LLVRPGVPSGAVTHAYGQAGDSVMTVEPTGAASYFFGDGTALRNGAREHDVVVGSRVIARVALTPSTDGGEGPGGPASALSSGAPRAFGGGCIVVALLLAIAATRVRVRRRAAVVVLAVLANVCSPNLATRRAASTIQAPA
jgi:hypothetical protein